MAGPRLPPEHIDGVNESIAEIPTPSLLVDREILVRNLDRMAQRMRALGVGMRPHVKTHKCLEIAEMQRRRGIVGITVATLGEARTFAGEGFTDLTWAFPLILNRIPEVRELADQLRAKRGTLRLVVDSPAAITALEQSRLRAHVWLKVDCGYHRAGVDPAAPLAPELARRLRDSSTLVFDGILTHAGHSYRGRSRRDLVEVAAEERRVMAQFADRLRDDGLEVAGVSVGSTPTMSVVEDLAGVTEVRPGNYVFYDGTQCRLGSCEVRDCALTVAASVVSSQPGSGHSVIDAGALSLSKDPGPAWVRPKSFGRILSNDEEGALDPEMRVVSLSQEHGIVNAPLAVGTRIRILINHSCLAVPNFSHTTVVEDDRVVGRWRIRR
ncbi:MAG: DSD1 family PLP-dependent enzyme [bacterium]|nr:DSD1 family PLP-dependent enzyme [bacterium]